MAPTGITSNSPTRHAWREALAATTVVLVAIMGLAFMLIVLPWLITI